MGTSGNKGQKEAEIKASKKWGRKWQSGLHPSQYFDLENNTALYADTVYEGIHDMTHAAGS